MILSTCGFAGLLPARPARASAHANDNLGWHSRLRTAATIAFRQSVGEDMFRHGATGLWGGFTRTRSFSYFQFCCRLGTKSDRTGW
jgi:hypothetical protein